MHVMCVHDLSQCLAPRTDYMSMVFDGHRYRLYNGNKLQKSRFRCRNIAWLAADDNFTLSLAARTLVIEAAVRKFDGHLQQ